MTGSAPAPVVVVAGHVTLDHYGDALSPGGPAFYAARAYEGLGARVRVVTAAASDFPDAALGAAEVVNVPSAATSRWTNAYGEGGERAQHVEATATRLDPGRLPPVWAGADLLHLAPVLAELEPAAWVRTARARFVGLGVQGCVRALAADGRVVQPRWEWAPGALRGVDAACVGEDDLCGQGDLLARLAAEVPVVAHTLGARGCEVFARGRTTRIGIYPTREIDPTGAGDVFAAGFFLALALGEDPVAAARLGAAAASIVVEGRGGDALPRIGEAQGRVAGVGPAQNISPMET